MQTKICNKCILPSTIPGISFDREGVCNFCHHFEKARTHEPPANYEEMETKMVEKIRRNSSGRAYDCLVLYSGGKDSTFMLYRLVNKLHLRVLALTFDNWFIAPETYANIRRVLSNINADHVFFRPSWEMNKSIFKAGLVDSHRVPRAKELAFMIGHACWPCFTQIGLLALKIALEKNIPSIVIGTTPGQMHQKRYDLTSKYNGILDTYLSMVVPMLKLLKITNRPEEKSRMELSWFAKLKALQVQLICFYEHIRYDERVVLETITKNLGWEKPRSTDSCSTNCQLNSLGIEIHKRRYGVSPYAIPLAHDVRSGLVDRASALRDVYENKLSEALVHDIAQKFGIDLEKIRREE